MCMWHTISCALSNGTAGVWGPPDCLAAFAVRASHLKWLPNGSSMPSETKCRFAGNQQSILPHGGAPVEPHIQLARLGPGQEIQLEAHCIKGPNA